MNMSDFTKYVATIQARVESILGQGTPIFTTDVQNLWEIYLDGFATLEQRQYHNCNCCKSFIRKYGHLAYVDNGQLVPLFWDEAEAIDRYKATVSGMVSVLKNASITGVFVSSDKQWGRVFEGGWDHFGFTQPIPYVESPTKAAHQAIAEFSENHKMVMHAHATINQNDVKTAITLLESGSLDYGDKYAKSLKWFYSTYRASNNNLWQLVASAKPGYYNPANGMTGALLEMIAAKTDITKLTASWNDMVSPMRYMRATVDPSDGNLAQAEQIIAKHGLVKSLARRYATLDDIQTFWKSNDTKKVVSGPVFGHLTPKVKKQVIPDLNLPASTMTWENRNDLDLHMITPRGEHIYFADMKSRCGGWLDIDMNRSGETVTPVENIRWDKGAAPSGTYRVHINNYRFHEPSRQPTPFKVEIEADGKIYQFGGTCHGQGTSGNVQIATIVWQPGRTIVTGSTNVTSTVSGGNWGVRPGQWVKVNALAKSPNSWDSDEVRSNHHIMFILQGCKDAANGVGRSFFTEMLKSELHPIRSTLEAFAKNAVIEDAESNSACGLGFTPQVDWNLRLKVMTRDSVREILIDRFD